MKELLYLLLFFSISSLSFSQNLTFTGILPAINITRKINNHLSVNAFTSTTLDLFERDIAGVEYPATDMQFYFQPSLIYIFTPNLNIAASYTYQRNNPLNNNFINEHRLWQQIIMANTMGSGKISHRFRIEERFIENKSTQQYPFSSRLRYQLGFSKPLQGRTLDIHEFYLNTYNEFYFSITKPRNAIFSENWSYLGLGYAVSAQSKIELGFLEQIAVRNKAQNLRFLNLAQISWISNLNTKVKQNKPAIHP